jgi:hypothetical protein
MADAPKSATPNLGTVHSGLIFQGPDGTYYKVPMSEIEKYKVPDGGLGGGEVVPAGCAVACWW